jgi:hypothetical protein
MTAIDLWGPLLSHEIIALASDRILKGGNLAESQLDKEKAKLVLIAVRLMNPGETLAESEEEILAGTTPKTLTGYASHG